MHIIKNAAHLANVEEEKMTLSHLVLPLGNGAGYVFALIRILGQKDEARARIVEIISERLVRFQETVTDEVNLARRFEQLLQAMNEDIAEAIVQIRSYPLSDMHALVGVLCENQVFVTGIGNLSALFMHKSAKQRYVIYELADQIAQSQDEQSWDKVFVTILDGELHPGDIFYLATRVPAREITYAEMQDILTTLPPSSSLRRIAQFLNPDTAYGAICFNVQEEPMSGPPKKTNPMHSVEELHETKTKTAQYLGENTPDISRLLSSITSPILKKLSSPGTRGYAYIIKRVTKLIIQLLILLITWTIKLLVVLGRLIWLGISHLPSIARHTNSIFRKLPNAKNSVKEYKERFQKMSSTQKYAILSISIAIILIFSSTIFFSYRHASQEHDEIFSALVLQVQEKINASQASMIYDDTAQAQTHLQEASAILATLDAQTRSQKTTLEQITKDLQSANYKVQHITPVEMTALAMLDGAQIEESFSLSDGVYAFGGGNVIYRLNQLEAKWQQLSMQSSIIGDIVDATWSEGNEFIFSDTSKQIGRANVESLSINPIVSGAGSLLSVDDILWYNDMLYILSADGKQVVKMREQGDGFEAGTPWITATNSDTNLENARAFAIDGNVYVLTADTIYKFLSGREQDFEIATTSPAMHDAKEIWTSQESQYIYVLEPAENRVIVFDKEGKLVAQYLNELIVSAVSMVIDESTKSLIIVTDTTAYQFSMTHLLQ